MLKQCSYEKEKCAEFLFQEKNILKKFKVKAIKLHKYAKMFGVIFLSRQNNNYSSLKFSLSCVIFSQQSTFPAKAKNVEYFPSS